MTWDDWHKILFEESIRLADDYGEWPVMAEPGAAAAQFRKFDEQTEKEVDEAIFLFAATGKWPHRSADAGAMIVLRFRMAARLASHLSMLQSQGLANPPPWDRTEGLRWFLLTTWEDILFEQIDEALTGHQITSDGDVPPAGPALN